jgi:hypothetical protein
MYTGSNTFSLRIEYRPPNAWSQDYQTKHQHRDVFDSSTSINKFLNDVLYNNRSLRPLIEEIVEKQALGYQLSADQSLENADGHQKNASQTIDGQHLLNICKAIIRRWDQASQNNATRYSKP